MTSATRIPAKFRRQVSDLHKLAGYTRVERPFANFWPLMDWIVVREELEQSSYSGLILLNKDHGKTGVVLKIGDRAAEMVPDLEIGDRVVYTEYAGGRWAFPDPSVPGGQLSVLIMEWQDVEARVHECVHLEDCDCPGHRLDEIPDVLLRPYQQAG